MRPRRAFIARLISFMRDSPSHLPQNPVNVLLSYTRRGPRKSNQPSLSSASRSRCSPTSGLKPEREFRIGKQRGSVITNHNLGDQHHKRRSGETRSALPGLHACAEVVRRVTRIDTSVSVLPIPSFLLNSQLAPTDH